MLAPTAMAVPISAALLPPVISGPQPCWSGPNRTVIQISNPMAASTTLLAQITDVRNRRGSILGLVTRRASPPRVGVCSPWWSVYSSGYPDPADGDLAWLSRCYRRIKRRVSDLSRLIPQDPAGTDDIITRPRPGWRRIATTVMLPWRFRRTVSSIRPRIVLVMASLASLIG